MDHCMYAHVVNNYGTNSVLPAKTAKLAQQRFAKYLHNIKSVDDVEWLCRSCKRYLSKGKLPSISNGMKFSEKPDFFDLNELECRLIALRLAFQKIMQAPRGKQFKITGNIVNVPADVAKTVNMLPRLPIETGTIKV